MDSRTDFYVHTIQLGTVRILTMSFVYNSGESSKFYYFSHLCFLLVRKTISIFNILSLMPRSSPFLTHCEKKSVCFTTFLENYKKVIKLQHFSNTLCKNCSTEPVRYYKWKFLQNRPNLGVWRYLKVDIRCEQDHLFHLI